MMVIWFLFWWGYGFPTIGLWIPVGVICYIIDK